jgi:hypothetical protein
MAKINVEQASEKTKLKPKDETKLKAIIASFTRAHPGAIVTKGVMKAIICSTSTGSSRSYLKTLEVFFHNCNYFFSLTHSLTHSLTLTHSLYCSFARFNINPRRLPN